MNLLAAPTKGLLNGAFDIWNFLLEIVWGMLEHTPETIADGTIWNSVVNTIEPIFVGVGTALVIIFFFWGWVKNSMDIHDDMRLENILKMLMRVSFAEFLVINNFEIMRLFFQSVGAAVRLLGNGFGITVNGDGEMTSGNLGAKLQHVEEMPELNAAIDGEFWFAIVVLLVSLVAFLVIAVLGVMLVLSVYSRFIKLFVVLPLGTLAFSTFAGDRETAHSSSAYFRYILGLALEAVAMGIALIISGMIINSGVLLINEGANGIAYILLTLCQICLQLAITVGTVRGAHELVSRTLGV